MVDGSNSNRFPEWTEDYASTKDLNEKYKLLREETARLRRDTGSEDRFDPEAVAQTVRDLNEAIDGDLLVFAANDFGLPVAFRPETFEIEQQDAVRQAILENKYDEQEDLNEIRHELLTTHPAIHKIIVAEYTHGNVRYHLPEGSNAETNFLTVREMVGLVDWTTNSFQGDGLSRTY